MEARCGYRSENLRFGSECRRRVLALQMYLIILERTTVFVEKRCWGGDFSAFIRRFRQKQTDGYCFFSKWKVVRRPKSKRPISGAGTSDENRTRIYSLGESCSIHWTTGAVKRRGMPPVRSKTSFFVRMHTSTCRKTGLSGPERAGMHKVATADMRHGPSESRPPVRRFFRHAGMPLKCFFTLQRWRALHRPWTWQSSWPG